MVCPHLVSRKIYLIHLGIIRSRLPETLHLHPRLQLSPGVLERLKLKVDSVTSKVATSAEGWNPAVPEIDIVCRPPRNGTCVLGREHLGEHCRGAGL